MVFVVEFHTTKFLRVVACRIETGQPDRLIAAKTARFGDVGRIDSLEIKTLFNRKRQRKPGSLWRFDLFLSDKEIVIARLRNHKC